MRAQAVLGVLLYALGVAGHGHIESPGSRGYLCYTKVRKNQNCGQIQYEPWSLEGPEGYPSRGPPDGRIAAAAANSRFPDMNVQTATRWHKVPLSSGRVTFKWWFQANHVTRDFKYYITRNGWNANAPLSRASFESAPFCTQDGGMRQPPTELFHQCNVPTRQGYHVILGVWDVGDTANSFYNVIDVQMGGGGAPAPAPAPVPPTPPAPQPQPQPQPPTGGSGALQSGQTYRLVVRASGKVLEVAGAGRGNGAKVQQWGWAGQANQQWRVRSRGGGRYDLTNVHSGKCLDVERVSRSNGARLQQWACSGGANQQFAVAGAGGGYYTLRAVHSGKCVDVDWNTRTHNGARVHQWSCAVSPVQQFRFELAGGGNSPPAPAPAPQPQPQPQPQPPSGGTCSKTIGKWGGCKQAPRCCAGGTRCYEQHQWYAQCLTSCSGAGWTCRVLG